MTVFSRNSLSLLLVLLLAACNLDRPGSVLGARKLEALLYDYHLAQAMADFSGDSVEWHRYVYVRKVFDKHGVTEAEFDSSMVWYSTHAGELERIYKHIQARLNAEIDAAGGTEATNAYASLTAEGDTANIWSGKKMLVVLQDSRDNLFKFTYVADTSFYHGDRFLWQFTTRYVKHDGPQDAVAALCVAYEGDSVVADVRTLHDESNVELSIYADKSLAIRSVSGFIYYPTSENLNKVPRRLFVRNPVLVRMHRFPKQVEPEVNEADSIAADSLAADAQRTDSIKTQTSDVALPVEQNEHVQRSLPSRAPIRRPLRTGSYRGRTR